MVSSKQLQAVEATVADIEKEGLLEYQYLFALVGRLRGIEPGLRQTDRRAAEKFLPAAFLFADFIEGRGLGRGLIDWSDRDAVALDFTKAWSSRRLPKDSRIFEKALAVSALNPLQLSESRNKWVNRIANLAFALSEMLPDTPSIIPVNDRTSQMLGVSIRTLSLALQEAIREKIVLVIDKPDQTLPSRRARRLKFNRRHSLVAGTLDGSRKRLWELINELDD